MMKIENATSPEYQRLLEEERLILAATELVYELMSKEGTSKADLARAIGKTRGYVTQILDGSRNMTLRTLADLALALGHRVDIEARLMNPRNQAQNLFSSSDVHDFKEHLQGRQPSREGRGAKIYKFGPQSLIVDEKKAAVGA